MTCIAAATWMSLPGVAEACTPDPCYTSNRWHSFDLVGDRYAPDGVLRFSPIRGSGGATVEEVLAYVDLQVADDMGTPVDGAFEYDTELRTYVWRPVAMLAADADYTATLTIDNDALAEALDGDVDPGFECTQNIEEVFAFSTTPEPLPELSVPEPLLSSEHIVQPLELLDSLVCCDDAYPYEETLCVDPSSTWDTGHCAASRAWGTVRANLSGPRIDDVPQYLLNNLSVRLVGSDGTRVGYASPGTFNASIANSEPFCARVEIVDLTYGEQWNVVQTECFGDELVRELGEHDIEPALAQCEGVPYTCEVVDSAWDSEQCTPWAEPPGEDESGGQTDESGGDDATGGGGDATGGGSGDGDGDGTGSDGSAGQDDDLDGRGCSCQADDHGGPTVAGLWMLVAMLGWGASRRRQPLAR